MVNESKEKPYSEKMSDGYKVRTFYPDVESEELKWHRDEKDRIVELLESTDWFFQTDNDLPVPFPKKTFIAKGEWHRVIKGQKILKIRITENE